MVRLQLLKLSCKPFHDVFLGFSLAGPASSDPLSNNFHAAPSIPDSASVADVQHQEGNSAVADGISGTAAAVSTMMASDIHCEASPVSEAGTDRSCQVAEPNSDTHGVSDLDTSTQDQTPESVHSAGESTNRGTHAAGLSQTANSAGSNLSAAAGDHAAPAEEGMTDAHAASAAAMQPAAEIGSTDQQEVAAQDWPLLSCHQAFAAIQYATGELLQHSCVMSHHMSSNSVS